MKKELIQEIERNHKLMNIFLKENFYVPIGDKGWVEFNPQGIAVDYQRNRPFIQKSDLNGNTIKDEKEIQSDKEKTASNITDQELYNRAMKFYNGRNNKTNPNNQQKTQNTNPSATQKSGTLTKKPVENLVKKFQGKLLQTEFGSLLGNQKDDGIWGKNTNIALSSAIQKYQSTQTNQKTPNNKSETPIKDTNPKISNPEVNKSTTDTKTGIPSDW